MTTSNSNTTTNSIDEAKKHLKGDGGNIINKRADNELFRANVKDTLNKYTNDKKFFSEISKWLQKEMYYEEVNEINVSKFCRFMILNKNYSFDQKLDMFLNHYEENFEYGIEGFIKYIDNLNNNNTHR